MRRIALWTMSTLSAVVLLLSYHTSTMGSPEHVAIAPIPSPSVESAAVTVPETFTGTAASTRYGPVQVSITVDAGTITSATAVDYPMTNGRDQQINARAVPTLEQETTTAQSADIDMVSGATYTSDGYVQSLQSAIDQANL